MPPKKQNAASGKKQQPKKKQSGDNDDFDSILKAHTKDIAKDLQKVEIERQKVEGAEFRRNEVQRKADEMKAKQQQLLADAVEVELNAEFALEEQATNSVSKEQLPPVYVDVVAKFLYNHLGGATRKNKFTDMFWLSYSLQTFLMACLEANRKLMLHTTNEEGVEQEEVVIQFEVHDKGDYPQDFSRDMVHSWNMFTTESQAQYTIDLASDQFVASGEKFLPEVPGYVPVLASSRLLVGIDKKAGPSKKPQPKNKKSIPVVDEKTPSSAPTAHTGILSIEAGIYPRPSYEGKAVVSEGVPKGTAKSYRSFLKKAQKKCYVGMDEEEASVATSVVAGGYVVASELEGIQKLLVDEFQTKPLLALRKK